MFIDASAIVAVLNNEAGSDEILRRLEDNPRQKLVSPLVIFESVAALARIHSGAKKPTEQEVEQAQQVVEAFIQEINAHEISITNAIGQKAIYAAKSYGKMVGHKADLNFGDCFSYACADAYNCKLVYVGNDFSRTDKR